MKKMKLINDEGKCLVCKSKAIKSKICIKKNKSINCIECTSCGACFLNSQNYERLHSSLNQTGQSMPNNIYECKFLYVTNKKFEIPDGYEENFIEGMITLSKIKNPNSNQKPKKQKNKKPDLHESFSQELKEKIRGCMFYYNKKCIPQKDICNPFSAKCRYIPRNGNIPNKTNNNKKPKTPTKQTITLPQPPKIKTREVTAIVLTHNKKCIKEHHILTDVYASFYVIDKKTNIRSKKSVLASYCENCDEYIVFKDDFNKLKKSYILLCKVIDKTPEHQGKYAYEYYESESIIHSLGYNVSEQYGYTFEQRKIILANIMENHNIPKHEILSMINLNISRKYGLSNYRNAIRKWEQDKEFVSNYKTGDIPEVLVDNVVVGGRR